MHAVVGRDRRSGGNVLTTFGMSSVETAAPERDRLVVAFFGAAALSIALYFLRPWGRFALYPFALLSTWAHEMGHGLTAILMGGDFLRLELYPSLGGQASHTAGGFFGRPLVSIGGLLGPAVAGAFVIVQGAKSERSAGLVLGALVAALALSTVIWIRTLFGFFAIGLISVALGALAAKGPRFPKLIVTQFIGIQFCLGSLADIDYMFTKSFTRNGRVMFSDTQRIAEHWLLPYWVWGSLIAAASIALLLAAFYFAWMRPES